MKNTSTDALLLIEFQNEWLSPQGKLNHLMQDRLQFSQSVEQAQRALAIARKHNMLIIHSGLRFSEDYHELKLAQHGLRQAIRKHQTFIFTESGHLFEPSFMPQPSELTVEGRNGSSAFSGSNLQQLLQNAQVERLYIMGYALHVCVESTLRMSHDLGYETVLIHDASAAFTQEQKNYVLSEVVHHFGQAITAENFITQLNQKGDRHA